MFQQISLSAIQLPSAFTTQGLFQAVAHHKVAISLASAFFVVALAAISIQFIQSSMPVASHAISEEPVAYQPSQAVSVSIRSSYLPIQ